MPQIAELKTLRYDLVIWARNIDSACNRFIKTLQARGKYPAPSSIIFSPSLQLQGATEPVPSYVLEETVFFENRYYDIEFIFSHAVSSLFEIEPFIEHRLKSVEDSFHYNSRSRSLRATFNTGNDIGWFKFTLVMNMGGRKYTQSFSFEILPVKMDLASDLTTILDRIDRQYPLWRYSLAEKTEQHMKAVKKPHPQFLLMWLAQFDRYQEDLMAGLKFILNSPHSRLVGIQKAVKMDRLKGRLSTRLEMNIVHSKKQGDFDKRFRQDSKKISVDTVENRFIKYVIKTAIRKLTCILNTLESMRATPDSQRLSDSFYEKLNGWQTELRSLINRPFFKEIGDYSGISRESLVLQQKPGYSRVYKIWQQLKWYLELLDGQSALSFRNVAELYEIWCFLEIRRILLQLGFKEDVQRKAILVDKGMEVEMKDGLAGAFEFHRGDGIKLKLVHERVFKKYGSPIRTWLVTQKPDILLEACFPDGSDITWLFDAKYRIKDSDSGQSETESVDLVPDDAINQMHRYRDALIHLNKKSGALKTRPVLGAYVLYPGFFDQMHTENPYADAIEEIGIGAFSVLPSQDGKGSYWLEKFIERKLAQSSFEYGFPDTDKFYVEDAPRISYKGTSVARYKNLTIVASQLGHGRNEKYLEEFRKGNARFYHTKNIAFKRQKIESAVISEAEFLCVAVDVGIEKREIAYVYPIISAERKQRGSLTEDQTGTAFFSDAEEMYWIFTLGISLSITLPIKIDAVKRFSIDLFELNDLLASESFTGSKAKYLSVR